MNDPQDPGGITNLGVTKNQWEKFVGHPVSEADMRVLVPARVAPFYRQEFWDRIRGDELPAGLDYCVFDMAVNSGPGRAAKVLQGIIGLHTDGAIGPETLSTAAARPAYSTISAFCAARLAYLKSLPGWVHDGHGWERRVHEVEQESISFAGRKEGPLVS